MQTALTIAGFDPSSGAGVTADLAVFAAHGLFGTACITALTVQSTLGVRAVHPVDPALVRDTLDCLAADLPPAGIKLGMLATPAIVLEVAAFLTRLRRNHPVPVVLDPVLRSTSGHPLLTPAALDLLRRELLPAVDWITPNHAELATLTGHSIESGPALEAAARALQRLAPSLNVLVTGGDQRPPDDLLLLATGQATWLPGERVDTTSTHGTGCALSSALLAHLLHGETPLAAARAAKHFVTEALRRAPGLGHGNGPANLLWPLHPDRTPPTL